MEGAKTILFIDDDREFLLGKKLFLEARGFHVLTAEGTEDALDLLGTETPDMIFVDLMIEHYDSGFTLSHRIRQSERFAKVPIVMLSGVASATGRRFDQEGASLKSWSKLDGFCDKPVTGRQVLQLIEEKLGLPASADGDKHHG